MNKQTVWQTANQIRRLSLFVLQGRGVSLTPLCQNLKRARAIDVDRAVGCLRLRNDVQPTHNGFAIDAQSGHSRCAVGAQPRYRRMVAYAQSTYIRRTLGVKNHVVKHRRATDAKSKRNRSNVNVQPMRSRFAIDIKSVYNRCSCETRSMPNRIYFFVRPIYNRFAIGAQIKVQFDVQPKCNR